MYPNIDRTQVGVARVVSESAPRAIHAFPRQSGRVLYEAVRDRQAPESFSVLAWLEGLGRAAERTRAVAWGRSTP
jgi:tryptophan synthase beta subunit